MLENRNEIKELSIKLPLFYEWQLSELSKDDLHLLLLVHEEPMNRLLHLTLRKIAALFRARSHMTMVSTTANAKAPAVFLLRSTSTNTHRVTRFTGGSSPST